MDDAIVMAKMDYPLFLVCVGLYPPACHEKGHLDIMLL
jgi:hypothetical protein